MSESSRRKQRVAAQGYQELGTLGRGKGQLVDVVHVLGRAQIVHRDAVVEAGLAGAVQLLLDLLA